VEIDGAHHMDVRRWADDMLRQNQVWIAGDRILRFPAWLVRAEPAVRAADLNGIPSTKMRPIPLGAAATGAHQPFRDLGVVVGTN
jgi:hypothetical protein